MKEGLCMIEKVLNSNNQLTDFQVKPVEGAPKIKEESTDPQNQNPKQPEHSRKK